LHTIESTKSKNYNWVFIAGGPGVPVDCYSGLIKRAQLPGTVYLVDIYKSTRHLSTAKQRDAQLKKWAKEILWFCDKVGGACLVTHSFSSMLILNEKKIPKSVKEIVLISPAPNRNWQKNVDKITKKVGIKKMSHANQAEAKFFKKKSTVNFKALWASWAPFYFSKKNWGKGARALKRLDYNYNAFLVGHEFWGQYSLRWQSDHVFRTVLVFGKNDLLTPQSDFTAEHLQKIGSHKLYAIPSAGHFPWVEQPQLVASVLQKVYETRKGVSK